MDWGVALAFESFPRALYLWSFENATPRGYIYTTIMESGPQNHNGDGLLGPNSIIVVYMDPNPFETQVVELVGRHGTLSLTPYLKSRIRV